MCRDHTEISFIDSNVISYNYMVSRRAKKKPAKFSSVALRARILYTSPKIEKSKPHRHVKKPETYWLMQSGFVSRRIEASFNIETKQTTLPPRTLYDAFVCAVSSFEISWSNMYGWTHLIFTLCSTHGCSVSTDGWTSTLKENSRYKWYHLDVFLFI